MRRFAVLTIAVLMAGSAPIRAQTVADPSLIAEISKIKAIDNHAHPLKYVAAGEKADDEFDALLFPLNNERAKQSNRDYKAFYPGEERLLKRYLGDLKISALPPTLDQYLKRVVTPTLERQKSNGAVAVKFEAAYLRKLDFDDPDDAKARATYTRFVRGGEPPAADYKAVQDFLFYYVAREAGRLGSPVHIHCISGA